MISEPGRSPKRLDAVELPDVNLSIEALDLAELPELAGPPKLPGLPELAELPELLEPPELEPVEIDAGTVARGPCNASAKRPNRLLSRRARAVREGRPAALKRKQPPALSQSVCDLCEICRRVGDCARAFDKGPSARPQDAI
jgi:hypothetical protein